MHSSSSLLQHLFVSLQAGDPPLLLIAGCGVFALILILERGIRLYLQYTLSGPALMQSLQKCLLSGDLEGALRTCAAVEGAPLARVLKAGLQRASRSSEQIQNALEAASLEALPTFEKRLPYLSLLANVSTLFGLLGTILGLIRSFSAISLADPSARQALLSQGISEAMTATAFGLSVAILSLVAHSFLSTQAHFLTSQMDEYAVKLLDLLSARRQKNSFSPDHETASP